MYQMFASTMNMPADAFFAPASQSAQKYLVFDAAIAAVSFLFIRFLRPLGVRIILPGTANP